LRNSFEEYLAKLSQDRILAEFPNPEDASTWLNRFNKVYKRLSDDSLNASTEPMDISSIDAP